MQPNLKIFSCEVCHSTELTPVLDLGKHPLCDDLIPVHDPRQCEEFPIEILYCDRCRTAHQKYQIPKDRLFPASYHYRSRFTADVLNGMAELVEKVCEFSNADLAGKRVVDIGCNDGSLLGFFQKKGALTCGVEPTGAAQDALSKGHLVLSSYFDADTANRIIAEFGHPDVITFTNVFAHIEDLPALIRALRILMKPETLLVVENHYLGAVIERLQFDTFYHEHPRTYSLTSFHYIAREFGLDLLSAEFPRRYGGNIRVIIGSTAHYEGNEGEEITAALDREAGFGSELRAMQARIARWRPVMRQRLEMEAARNGPLCGKAFPGRAAILVKLLDLGTDTLSRVYEKPGSMKIGHYIPGTRIPILSDDDFNATDPKPPVLLNLAWHISREIRDYMSKIGYNGRIIDILDPKEFV